MFNSNFVVLFSVFILFSDVNIENAEDLKFLVFSYT